MKVKWLLMFGAGGSSLVRADLIKSGWASKEPQLFCKAGRLLSRWFWFRVWLKRIALFLRIRTDTEQQDITNGMKRYAEVRIRRLPDMPKTKHTEEKIRAENADSHLVINLASAEIIITPKKPSVSGRLHPRHIYLGSCPQCAQSRVKLYRCDSGHTCHQCKR